MREKMASACLRPVCDISKPETKAAETRLELVLFPNANSSDVVTAAEIKCCILK
jgi:hypothetical protein